MARLPKVFKPYIQPARRLIKDGGVKDVEFSGSTYQILVEDSEDKDGVWAFLQLDEAGGVRDCFCGCDEGDADGGCRHLAAAYLKIFNDHAVPLHIRFEHSLWHRLCCHYAEKVGYDSELLKHLPEGGYEHRSISGKRLFFVQGIGEEGVEQLYNIMEMRIQETEETSLKFSNLPQNEIQLWKEGRPTLRLLYHLSFWNDLAKWMMVLQEQDPSYQISFEYSPQGIPNLLKVKFALLEAEFYVPEAVLATLIPALEEVESPIPVRDFAKEAISKITYDEDQGCLKIHHSASQVKQANKVPLEVVGEVWRFGEWRYSPSVGFFHTEEGSLLAHGTVSGNEVSEVLQNHLLFVKEKLEGVALHEESVDVAYDLSFDSTWNLHIRAYLFQPGDLQRPRSRAFGQWAYLDGNGFYRLRNMRTEDVEEVIPAKEVSDFVTQNRIWLVGQEGFSPHLANVEAEMSYEVDGEGNLRFASYSTTDEGTDSQKDFGRWVYMAGQGFFSKVGVTIGLPVRPGVVVRPDALNNFIHMNRDELQLVPGFFSRVCPVVRSELRVELTEGDQIRVTPNYERRPEYKNRALMFFGDYVYVPNEGFYCLPAESLLPEAYRQTMLVDSDNQALFLNYDLEHLKSYIAYLDPRLARPATMTLVAEDLEEGSQGKGWYSLRLAYITDRGSIPITTLWRAMADKERFVFSPAGLIDLQDSRFAWLHSLRKQRFDLRRNTVLLSTMELIRLNVFDEIHPPTKDDERAACARQLLRELTTFQDPNPPNIVGLRSTLRPYQHKGVHWLWFLYHHGLSGLLCDDMGLGKTHQSMALMQAISNDLKEKGSSRSPKFLVVCPTSVIYHWAEKLQEFLTGMRVHTFYGLERTLDDFDDSCQILLTSYGVWRREVARLKEIKFDLAVFDEIQAAKSQASRLHHALLQVQATMRVGLTGTPIENHLMELKALFDIALPTYMPSDHDYREFFLKPIDKDQDVGRRQLLSRLIKPFIMRRKKEDVLTDLPEKTEEVFHCQLSDEQRRLYREVLDQTRPQVIDDLKDSGKAVPFVHIFAILTQLKRICNHPAVFLKTPQDFRKHESGKWELFVELLSEARASGQKVVVFTHYLAMLDIFEDYLTAEGIRFASVRGSTTNRGEQLRLFNQDPDCEVFLGSLQAVGLGVDLTAASVVIHYDRWWNAARENQATDRVHRIGQTRGVQVFKLVTKGTFEERIDALISAKGKLMEEVVGVDDQDVVKRLDRAELIELLQYVDDAAGSQDSGASDA
jgi:superfamily II DNA or RNA helicase